MNALRQEIRGRVRRDEPLAMHTSGRVGGPAARFFEPADPAEVAPGFDIRG